jgi:phosphatidylserine decarboxylase
MILSTGISNFLVNSAISAHQLLDFHHYRRVFATLCSGCSTLIRAIRKVWSVGTDTRIVEVVPITSESARRRLSLPDAPVRG